VDLVAPRPGTGRRRRARYHDEYIQGGLFPVAYTIGTDLKPARRKDVDDIIHWNGW
jgi:hypothetical protein